VRAERTWPPADVEWTRLWLAPDGLREEPVENAATERRRLVARTVQTARIASSFAASMNSRSGADRCERLGK
jgi:hypothetical protein